jgi:7-cyano-7-deazaguanine synthase
MPLSSSSSAVGLLLSGGLDSGILLGHLLHWGYRVQPMYVRAGLHWERDELRSLASLLTAMDCDRLEPLVRFEMPLADVYGEHWSVSGLGVPDGETADDAVYLPGRNAILIVKAAVWCRMHGIEKLALAVLKSNPFGDASDAFFERFESALALALGGRVEIVRPFGHLTKREVMELGRDMPLELTFSCIDPRDGQHCGRCNKCAERLAAFRSIGKEDPAQYNLAMNDVALQK